MEEAKAGTKSRREREKQQRREDILEAAEELFDEKGYEATTIEEIARRTELSKGTIYLYFRSKDELFLSVCAKGITGFRDHIAKAVERKRGIESKMKTIYLSYIEFFLAVPHIFGMLRDTYNERTRHNLSRESIDIINWTIAEVLYYASLFTQQGIDAGLFRKDIDPYDFSVMAWRTATGLIELAILNEPGVADKKAIRRMFSESIELLMGGLKHKA